MSMTTIDKIVRRTRRIRNGNDAVRPGQPAAFTAACVDGDTIRQGNLYIKICSAVPDGYFKVNVPTETDKQLVPGNTQGEKHCLDSFDGVTLYRPDGWGAESLNGPYLRCAEARTILHPTHGAVQIQAGQSVLCWYQREYDAEQKRERRAAD